MRAVVTKSVRIASYLAFVAGVGGLCVYLAGHVGSHAVFLASPYLMPAQSERRPTLVERRQIEAAVVLEANPQDEAIVIPDAPDVALPVLAAQMDLAEDADLVKAKPAVRRISRARTRNVARPALTPAADVFGRSFGVMLMASR